MATKTIINVGTGEIEEVPLTPEEEAAAAASAAAAQTSQAQQVFAASEDDERLALIAERAQTDPAYAALSEIVLKGRV